MNPRFSSRSPGSLRVTSLLLAVVLAGAVPAAALDPPAPDGSVAVSDGLTAPLVQPAALTAGRAAGIGVEYAVPLAGFDTGNPFDGLSAFLNADGFAYAYQRAETADLSTISVAFGGNLSLGGSYRWTHGSFGSGGYLLGLLARPVDALSVGLTYADTIGGGARELRAGLGIRPLAFTPLLGHRLTLSADTVATFAPNAAWTLPFVRVAARPVDGLRIAGGYDLETSRWQLGSSVSLGSVVGGSRVDLDRSSRVQEVRIRSHLSTRRYPSVLEARGRQFVYYEPGPQIVEYAPSVPGGLFETPGGTPLLRVLQEIDALSKDPTVAGIVFRNHSLNASYANILEIRDALQRFKETGRSVYFYFDSASSLNYALAASVGDGVFLNPAGRIGLTGFASGNLYAAELLQALGVQVVNFRSHRYKAAFNALSESEMTEAEREALAGVLAEYQEALVSLIDSGRSEKLSADAGSLVADGPYLTAAAAEEAGLVDALLYQDQLEDAIRQPHPEAVFTDFPATQQARVTWSRPPASKVAVIYATGSIVTGSGAGGNLIGSETMSRLLRRAREDAAVRAVLIRIDSGGGSGLASEIIAREVALTRKAGKPVVVSMASTAASGGYFIAAAADRIVAQPVTLTGSIGVTALSIHVEGLLDRLRLTFSQVATADSADFLSSFEPPEEADIAKMEESIDWQYQRFVQAVAEGRNMSVEAVEEVAKGRIWSGKQALERGLVDELGGFADAVEAARKAAGIVGAVNVVPFTEMMTVEDLMEAAQSPSAANELENGIQALAESMAVYRRLAEDGLLYYEPLTLRPE